jgi:hypothetical protein
VGNEFSCVARKVRIILKVIDNYCSYRASIYRSHYLIRVYAMRNANCSFPPGGVKYKSKT